jgi:hypothetical protein
MHDRVRHSPIASDLKFIVWTTIVLIGLSILSVALGISIDPDASIFSSP